jgi:hypothetical protein
MEPGLGLAGLVCKSLQVIASRIYQGEQSLVLAARYLFFRDTSLFPL